MGTCDVAESFPRVSTQRNAAQLRLPSHILYYCFVTTLLLYYCKDYYPASDEGSLLHVVTCQSSLPATCNTTQLDAIQHRYFRTNRSDS